MAGRLSWRRNQKVRLALLDAPHSTLLCFMIYEIISLTKLLSKSSVNHYQCQPRVSTGLRNQWSTLSMFWDDQIGWREDEEGVMRWLAVMEKNSEAGGQKCQPGECNHLQKFLEIWDRKQNCLQFIWYQYWIVKWKVLWKKRGFKDFWVILHHRIQTWTSMVITFQTLLTNGNLFVKWIIIWNPMYKTD